MHEIVLHEVATPLHIDQESWDSPFQANDESYRKYTRLLEKYDRMAWQYHKCSYCNEPIRPGEWYDACVWLSVDRKTRKVWVEKHHYPECPERLRDLEEEMKRMWEKEDRERERADRKVA
jgi:hypothetical protein